MAGNLIYAVNIAQFLLGIIITVINLILWLAIATNANMRDAPHCLLGNMWFANLLLGVIVAISNVVDHSDVYVFQKTEGTIAIVNGFVTISMLLALTTNRVVTIRNPSKTMSTKTSVKIMTAVWGAVLTLTFIKAIVFGLNSIGIVDACFKCFLSFEVSTLVIFAVATLAAFFISVYMICSHRNRSIGDASGNASSDSGGLRKEYRTTLTIGLLLSEFSLTFLAFVFLIPAWLTNGSLDRDAAEVIITLFYTHSIINPIIALCRDTELRKSARSIVLCQRQTSNSPPAVPPDQIAINNGTGQPIMMIHQPIQMVPIDRLPPPINNPQPLISQNQPQHAPVLLPPIDIPPRLSPMPPLTSSGDRRRFNFETDRPKSPEKTYPSAPSEENQPLDTKQPAIEL